MELSVAYELYMPPHVIDTDTAMGITAGAGFRYADMSLGPFCFHPSSPVLKPGWEEWADDTVRLANRHGLTMLQAHCFLFNYLDRNSPDYRRYTDANLHLLDVCARMGISYLVFHPGTAHGHVSSRESLTGSREWLLPFVEKGEKLGVKICLENVFDDISDQRIIRTYGSRPEELAELADSFGKETVGICWDCGHAQVTRLCQSESLRILGNRVLVTHIHDNRGQYANDLHLPPFYGSLDWPDLMKGLNEIGYSGTLNFEIERHTIPMDFMAEELRSVYAKGQRLLEMI